MKRDDFDLVTKAYTFKGAQKQLNSYLEQNEKDTAFLFHLAKSQYDIKLMANLYLILVHHYTNADVIVRVGKTSFLVYSIGAKSDKVCQRSFAQVKTKFEKCDPEQKLHLCAVATLTAQYGDLMSLCKELSVMLTMVQRSKQNFYFGTSDLKTVAEVIYPHVYQDQNWDRKAINLDLVLAVSDLLNQGTKIEVTMNQIFILMADYFKVHHLYVSEKDKIRNLFIRNYELKLVKHRVENENFKYMSAHVAQEIINLFDDNGLLVCNRVDELLKYSTYFALRMKISNAKSLLISKIVEHQEFFGVVCMIDESNERIWTVEEIATFAFLSRIINQYLMKERIARDSQNILDYDALTNVWSYHRFLKHTALQIENTSQNMAILTVDLKDFKYINIEYGYNIGNHVLVLLAQLVSHFLETSESFARIDADCFVILINYVNQEQLYHRLDNLIHRIEQLPAIHNYSFRLMCMIGVYLVEDKTITISEMVDHANGARRAIKNYHKSSYNFYSSDWNEIKLKEHQFSSSMKQALQDHEFIVYYQPQVLVSEETCVSLEALVRWKKNGKIILPGEFLPLFEKNGFISEIDMFVLEEVCKLIKSWIDAKEVLMPIAINISRTHLMEPDIVSRIIAVCQKYQVPTKYIDLEITESAFLENEHEVMERAIALKNAGFTISMDDFGTGYSSLALLKDIPMDILKLDREFFTHLMNEREKIIISNIIKMARELGIAVISEGIETSEQVQFLKKIGCELAQGYYYSRPQPFLELMANCQALKKAR